MIFFIMKKLFVIITCFFFFSSDLCAEDLKIKTVPATNRLITRAIEKSGEIIPGKSLGISSEVGGLLEKLAVEKGDPVTRGMTLADVDRKTARLLVEEAQAHYEEALIKKKLVEKPYREEELKIFRLKVDQAETEKRYAESDWKRISKLFAEGHTSQEQLDLAETGYQKTLIALEITKKRLEMAVDGPRSEETQAAEIEVLKAGKNLEISENNLRKTRVISVVDGVVAEKYVEEGEFVNAGQELIEVVVLNPVKLSFAVSESELAWVEKGSKIEFVLPAIGQTFSGKVGFISPVADSKTHLFGVELSVPNRDRVISPGMMAKARLTTKKIVACPVNVDWLRFHKNQLGVFLLSGGKVKFIPVNQENYLAKEILLYSGIEKGDKIVTFASRELIPGEVVEERDVKIKKELVLMEEKK